MFLRRNILPKTLLDFACSVFVLLIIPILYWFELFIVLPTYYQMWSFWYNLHFICGNFVAMNIITNFVWMILCDTSVRGRVIPTEMKPGWRFCSVCEIVAPPRSWHCEICKTCILKRDHHCVFSGCCIGHENTRYFLMFTAYAFIATVYSTYFNSFFITSYVNLKKTLTWLKIVFPLAMLVYDNTQNQLYLLIFLLVIIAMVFTGFLTYFHLNLIINGQITHEHSHRIAKYDFGRLQNIENVLGVKWYLCWICPLLKSKLPHDGINWETKESVKMK